MTGFCCVPLGGKVLLPPKQRSTLPGEPLVCPIGGPWPWGLTYQRATGAQRPLKAHILEDYT